MIKAVIIIYDLGESGDFQIRKKKNLKRKFFVVNLCYSSLILKIKYVITNWKKILVIMLLIICFYLVTLLCFRTIFLFIFKGLFIDFDAGFLATSWILGELVLKDSFFSGLFLVFPKKTKPWKDQCIFILNESNSFQLNFISLIRMDTSGYKPLKDFVYVNIYPCTVYYSP